MQLYKGLLELNDSECKTYGSVNYWEKNGKLYIDAYHPAQKKASTGISRQQYCDDIIIVVETFFNNKKI